MKSGVVLVVDDNPGDVRLIREALRSHELFPIMSVARDGVEAGSYLRRMGGAGLPRPDLILLDLNLPGKSGLEVLSEMRGDPNLRSIPVVVFSGSESEDDVAKSYALNATSYVTKPSDVEQYMAALRTVIDYWLGVTKLPAATPGLDAGNQRALSPVPLLPARAAGRGRAAEQA